MPDFEGASPGQDLSAVVGDLNSEHLQTLLGPDVLRLVDAITHPDDRFPALRRAALRAFRDDPEGVMRQPAVRQLLLDAMSPPKLGELGRRLGIPDVDLLRTAGFDPDPGLWRDLLGFFGLDPEQAAPASVLPSSPERVAAAFPLFPHQRSVVNDAYQAVAGGHGRVVIHMPTGTGKTRTAMHLVSRILAEAEPCVVVWLAASVELLEQAADAFQTAWASLGNREVTLTRLWGTHSPDLLDVRDGLLVAGFQKLHAGHSRNPVDTLRLGARTQLVVVDEAHQSIAATYRQILDALAETGPRTALVGLTATPGRTWSDVEADQRLSEYFGERKVTVKIDDYQDPVSGLVKLGYMARVKFSRLEVHADPELRPRLTIAEGAEEYSDEVLAALALQWTRNVVIVNEIRRLMADGHKRIMFFGASVQHARLIVSGLAAIDVAAHLVTASTRPSSRRRIIRAFRSSSDRPMVLCNYGVLTAGFDAPNTSACVIARPTKSLVLFSQMVGRATRGPRAGGNEICAVSTVVDVDLPGFRDVAEAFMNWEDVWT